MARNLHQDSQSARETGQGTSAGVPRRAGRLKAGLGGALALTAIHELGRRLRNDAPRMDVVGGRALVLLAKAVGISPPRGERLYAATLASDILSNSLFYAACLSSRSKRPVLRAMLTGAAAGYGAYALPPLLGLGSAPRSRHPSNRAMTVAWYAIGGLVSAALYGGRRR